MVDLVPKYWLYLGGIRDGFVKHLDAIMSKTSVLSPSDNQRPGHLFRLNGSGANRLFGVLSTTILCS